LTHVHHQVAWVGAQRIGLVSPSDTTRRAVTLPTVSQGDLAEEAESPPAEESSSRIPALSLLRGLSTAAPEARWRYWVVAVDSIGRVTLPSEARPAGGQSALLLVTSRERALVIRRTGIGSRRHLDGRGRLTLPEWLRRFVGLNGSVLVAASVPDASTVAIAATSSLDSVLGELAGEVE
jgi:bifunctional DNA-binding transcriptional regulator/antitoxin component of YhaV-PrlF toxin-antitoxin module